jgi:integrase
MSIPHARHVDSAAPDRSRQGSPPGAADSSWTAHYGEKHRWRRIAEFPAGIAGPKRVRIYQRTAHYILQWWDSAAGGNLSARVDGDLVAAIVRAREIEARLEQYRASGEGRRRVKHQELVERFITDLDHRADAGEIDPRTAKRYGSALAHYVDFVEQPQVSAAFPSATQVNRDFVLQFAAYLESLRISPNGHPHAELRKMSSGRYVEDVARSMFAWAADPDRGGLLGTGFRNPFGGRRQSRQSNPEFLFGEPDITMEMAAEFLLACDGYQLPLFATLMFYGLRAAEPCYIFREHLVDGWLHVASIPELDHFTKGRRDKRFALITPLAQLLSVGTAGWERGLLFLRRSVVEGREQPSLLHEPLEHLVTAFELCCQKSSPVSAAKRRACRDEILNQAGGLKYDHLEGEFHRVIRQLNWPAEATLKDFRHLFSTLLQNAGMPEYYRRYLMGHSPGRAAIGAYTHLNDLQAHYQGAVDRGFQPLVEAAVQRADQLGLASNRIAATGSRGRIRSTG